MRPAFLIVTLVVATWIFCLNGSATTVSPDVSWTFDNSSFFDYVLNSYGPSDYNIGASVGAQDPTINLEVGRRYGVRIINFGTHPFEVLAKGATFSSDAVLLSQHPGVTGSFEADPGVNWQDSSTDTVEFTLTQNLVNAMKSPNHIPGYRCGVHISTMRGNFNVISTGTVSGKVTLQNVVDNSTLVTFELRQPGTTAIIVNAANDEDPDTPGTQITTAADGSYALNLVPEGTYDLTAKGSKWLKQKQPNSSVLGGGVTTVDFLSLKGGDANNSNNVNILDLNILKGTYGKMSGQPGYDDRADFNKTNSVNILDLNILKSNYGKAGDQ
jgi:hypothetical protein